LVEVSWWFGFGSLGALPLPFCSLVLFQRVLLLSVLEQVFLSQHHLINAIAVEEELEAAQSKASSERLKLDQVRWRTRRTFQRGWVIDFGFKLS
jgi:hypothetical protein